MLLRARLNRRQRLRHLTEIIHDFFLDSQNIKFNVCVSFCIYTGINK